jgi:hypothetical protein
MLLAALIFVPVLLITVGEACGCNGVFQLYFYLRKSIKKPRVTGLFKTLYVRGRTVKGGQQ